MKTLSFVWGLIAFPILGLSFSVKAETFDVTQDFESNFEIVSHPEEFLPNWSANEVRSSASRVFQANGKGVDGSNALGIQPIGSFDAEIYIKITRIGLENSRISFKAKTNRNGSGDRPVYMHYSFSEDGGVSYVSRQQLGNDETFQNEDTPYREYEFEIPEDLLGNEALMVKLEVLYGEGSGTAARLFIDDFTVHGLRQEIPDSLRIISIERVGDKSLVVDFNQPIRFTGDEIDHAVSLNHSYGIPEEVEITEQRLFLEFADYLYTNQYELTFHHLASEANSDIWMGEGYAFQIVSPTPYGTVLINEFMADPNPKGMVPQDPVLPQSTSAEYIELFNAVDKPVQLNGFTYNGSDIEDFTLDPGGYLLLVAPTNQDLFRPFGATAPVERFSTLGNSSGSISLLDPFGNLVDSISYSLDWFDDQTKSRGGWSLERVNPFQSCSHSSNWKASVSLRGGTPGAVNSVYDESPEPLPFVVERLDLVSENEIQIQLSLPLNTESIQHAAFTINGVSVSPKQISGDVLNLSVGADMEQGEQYILVIEDLYDCFGRMIQETGFPFVFDREGPRIVNIGSLSGQELMVYFDEPILGQSGEKQENYLINEEMDWVQEASLADPSTVRLFLERPLPQNQHHNLTVFNMEDSTGNMTLEDTMGFLMVDQLDTVIYAGPNLLDLHFKIEVDSASVQVVTNYAVDRQVGHPAVSYRDGNDFSKVHLVFERDLPVNAVMKITVQHLKDLSGSLIHTHSRNVQQDNRAIQITTVEIQTDSTLTVTFNKPLLPAFATVQRHYEVDEGVGHPVEAIQESTQTVRLTFQKKFEDGVTYRLSVGEMRDVFGVEMPKSITVSFEFDLSPPFVVKARLIHPYGINLEFNEPVSPFGKADFVIIGHQITEVEAVGDSEAILITEESLTGDSIRLLISGLTDLKGNRSDSLLVEIPNDKITLGEATIVREDQIHLIFSADVDPSTSLQPDHYRIMQDMPRLVTLGEVPFELFLHLNSELNQGDSLMVEVLSIKSKEGKTNQNIRAALFYDDGIAALFVVNGQLIHVLHHLDLDKNEVEQADFAFMDDGPRIQPLVNETDPKLLQLVLEQPLIPNLAYELIIPQRKGLDGQKLPGSRRTVVWDQSPPRLVMVEALNEQELLVSFDEALDPILSLVTVFYGLDGQNPLEVIPGEMPHQVILVFSESFQSDKTYELTVVQVEDTHRNAIEEERLAFVFDGPVSPVFKEVVINEVMAAPTPGNDLPNTEYVELFNAGNREVFLGGLSLANSRSSTVLPRVTLSPGEFLILVPAGRRDEMAEFGKVVGLANWPTLLNEGDEVRLLNNQGVLLDELIYNIASYGSAEKAQAGVSLEVVNPFAPCSESANLKPSESPRHGTPGAVNSVFDDTPDSTRPRLLKAYPKDKTNIVLEFSKPINSNLAQVEIKGVPLLGILSIAIDEANPKLLVVELHEALEENRQYSISVEQVRDCAGNLIDPDENTAYFKIPVEARQGDILLNEVLFNARTGFPKFVEIYNRSDKYINLKNWKLGNIADGEISNRKIVATEDLILDSFSFLVFTTDATRLYEAYPRGNPDTFISLTSLPSYPIATGTVVLLNQEEDIVERFDYSEKFHHALLDEVRGVSLERHSLGHDGNDPQNWHSASATEGYATPGYKNSQAYQASVLEKGITIYPRVFVPDGPSGQNFTRIEYKMENPGFVATLRIYNINGQLIKELCQNDVWGSSGFYTWDGTDRAGRKMRPGYYIVWVEVLNLEGRVENLKKTVVVGSRF